MQSTALEPTMATNISFDATSATAKAANCSSSDAYSANSSIITSHRSLSMEKLLNLTLSFISETSAYNDGDISLPSVDQEFLPELASELVATGKFPKIPLMAGWMQDDATLFADRTIKTANETKDLISLHYSDLNTTILTSFLDLYPVADFSANTTAKLTTELYRTAQLFRDILLTCPSFYFASAMVKKYTNETQRPVYLYSHSQTILGNYLDSTGSPELGVIYTSKLLYIYGNLSIFNVTDAGSPGCHFAPSTEDYELTKQLPRSWASFATEGRPSVETKDTMKA